MKVFRKVGASLLVAVGVVASAHAQAGGSSGPWVMEQSGTTAGLRGIHAVSAGVAWASGTGGTILRTVDGGATWTHCAVPPDGARLDFRGIWAWDARTAIAMSSGPGDLSRLYKTTDGCRTWKLLFTNPDKDGFWDGINCADKESCMLVGDPVNNTLVVYSTDNGESTWTRDRDSGLKSVEKEGVFAASNSSLGVDWVDGPALLGTGSAAGARILVDCDACQGDKWSAHPVSSFPVGQSAGVFSVDYRDWRRWVAVGGDYTKPNDSTGTAAWSTDGGKTWHASAKPPHGYRSAVTWDADAKAWITVGTNGSDISYDDGKTWLPLDNGNWNALSLPWVVGPNGRIARLDPKRLKP